MKCLTVCQPYASLIVGWEGIDQADVKRVENRKWRPAYRGPLLIHAGTRAGRPGRRRVADAVAQRGGRRRRGDRPVKTRHQNRVAALLRPVGRPAPNRSD